MPIPNHIDAILRAEFGAAASAVEEALAHASRILPLIHFSAPACRVRHDLLARDVHEHAHYR